MACFFVEKIENNVSACFCKSLTNFENHSSHHLQEAFSGFQVAACDSKSQLWHVLYSGENHQWGWKRNSAAAFMTIIRFSSVLREAGRNCLIFFSFTRQPKKLLNHFRMYRKYWFNFKRPSKTVILSSWVEMSALVPERSCLQPDSNIRLSYKSLLMTELSCLKLRLNGAIWLWVDM